MSDPKNRFARMEASSCPDCCRAKRERQYVTGLSGTIRYFFLRYCLHLLNSAKFTVLSLTPDLFFRNFAKYSKNSPRLERTRFIPKISNPPIYQYLPCFHCLHSHHYFPIFGHKPGHIFEMVRGFHRVFLKIVNVIGFISERLSL